MPGFKCHAVKSEERFRCGVCGLYCREPVQNMETGEHFCASCVKEDPAVYRRDKAFQKEMDGLDVYCELCDWKGKFTQLEAHLCSPPTYSHRENVSLKERLAVVEKKLFIANQQRAELEEILKDKNLKLKELVESNLPVADTFIIEEYLEVKKQPPMEESVELPSSSDFDTIADTLEDDILDLSEGQKKVEKYLDEGEQGLMKHAKCTKVLSQRSAFESAQLLGNDSFEKPVGTSGDFRVFSNGAGPQPNGSGMQCQWRIPDISQELKNSRKYPYRPLVSPVWSTQPCGYCMQAFLYPNGCKDSLRGNASIFIKMVPGNYDDSLKWPLDATLTFCLIDSLHDNARPWVRNCRSNPDCPRFKQRPPPLPHSAHEMNIASGFLNFIPIDNLEKYTKDDTIMLEMSLRPNTIF